VFFVTFQSKHRSKILPFISFESTRQIFDTIPERSPDLKMASQAVQFKPSEFLFDLSSCIFIPALNEIEGKYYISSNNK
jgi:hypothetical protein